MEYINEKPKMEGDVMEMPMKEQETIVENPFSKTEETVTEKQPTAEELLQIKMDKILAEKTKEIGFKKKILNALHGTPFAEASPEKRKEQIAKGIARMEGDEEVIAEFETLKKTNMAKAREYGKEMANRGKLGNPDFKKQYQELLKSDTSKALKFAYAIGSYKYPVWKESENDYVDNTKYEGKDSGGTAGA